MGTLGAMMLQKKINGEWNNVFPFHVSQLRHAKHHAAGLASISIDVEMRIVNGWGATRFIWDESKGWVLPSVGAES